MKRIFFYVAIVTLSFLIFSCASSIPQHCPSYQSAYGKEMHKTTKGINKNIFANGIRMDKHN